MTIFFYKRLTRNPEIENTTVSVLPNIWRLVQVRDTKFGTNISSKMLLNAAKCQGYRFYHFWVIKGKPKNYPPIQIRVKVEMHLDTCVSINIFRKGSVGLFQEHFASISEIQFQKELHIVKSLQIIHFLNSRIFCVNFPQTNIFGLIFYS